MNNKATAKSSGVRALSSVLKSLAVLDALTRSNRPLRLMELAQALGESRATTYQRLLTLTEGGWVEQTGEGAYRLSLQAARAGNAALEQANLGERSTEVLQQLVLETRETASLAALAGVQAQLIKRVEAEVVVRAQVQVGTLLSLDQSASGRVLTAFATPAQRALLERKGATLASAALLREVARRGYAVSSGKDVPGLKSVAAPVFDAKGTCLFALSLVAPTARFDEARLARPVTRSAEKLSALLSG
ncbi:MAG TPA: IclR family transcriptional regulator [Burkholderiales bacterium]|nr:IclR family transcriptional regulator [Burkholderiales bacterium]